MIDSTNDPNCVIGKALKVYILPVVDTNKLKVYYKANNFFSFIYFWGRRGGTRRWTYPTASA